MSNQNYVLKMAQLVGFLKNEVGGTADQLAEKMNISRRTMFRYLEELRDIGAEIEYCRENNSYFIRNEFDFLETFFKSVL